MKKSTKHLIIGAVLMAAYLAGYTIIQFVLLLNGVYTALSVLDFSYPFDVAFGVILFTLFLKRLNSNKGAVSIKKAAIGACHRNLSACRPYVYPAPCRGL